MRYFLTLLVLLSLFSITVWGQSLQLRGRVSDQKGKALAYATVVVTSDSVGAKDVRYAITKPDGSFHITRLVEQASYWVHVRFVGYEDYRHRFLKLPTDLLIQMEELVREMERVVVVAKAPDVYEKGDTLVYNPKKYTLGNEQNIGQVIKRMPGMEVSQSGKVSYQGEDIGKVLVNGEDVLGASAEGIAINNLPPDFAYSIELIKNYKDTSDIVRNFKESKMMALNLKSDRKVTLNGAMEGSGGLINKFGGRVALISMLPKLTMSMILSANNTGKELLTLEDYTSNLDPESLGEGGNISVNVSGEERELFVHSDNEYERIAGLANVNLTLTPHRVYRLKSSTIYNQSEARSGSRGWLFYYRPEDNFESTTEEATRRRNENLWQRIYQKFRPTQGLSIKSGTDLYYQRSTSDDFFENRYRATLLSAGNKHRGGYFRIKQSLELQGRVGKGLFYTGGQFHFNDGVLQQHIYSTEALLPLSYDLDEECYRWNYEKESQKQEYRFFGGIIYPMLEKLFIKTEISYGRMQEELSFHDMNWHPAAEEGVGMVRSRLYVGAFRNLGTFTFSAGSYLSHYGVPKFLTSSKALEARLYVEPTASLAFQISKIQNLNFSISETVGRLPIEELSQVVLPKAYNSLQYGVQIATPFTRSLNGLGRWYYFDLFERLVMSLSLYYAKARDQKQYVSSASEIFASYYYRSGGWRDIFHSNLNIQKGIPRVPIDVRGYFGASWQKSSEEYNAQSDERRYLNFRGQITLVTRYQSIPVNGEISVRYDRGEGEFLLSDAMTTREFMRGEATIHFTRGNFTSSLRGKFSRLRLATTNQDFADFDATLSYKIRKVSISVSGEDLLHLRTDEWVTDVFTTQVRGYNRYRRMAGYALLSLRWEF